MNKKEKNSIKESIVKKIKEGDIKMKPKAYFTLKNGLLIIGIILTAFLLLYLISFILFILHVNGIWFLPGFGWRGIGSFLFSFPWLILLIIVSLIVILEVLVKKFSFSYKNPLIYSIIGILAISIIGGTFLFKTPLHRGMMISAFQGKNTITGELYRGYGMQRLKNATLGKIIELRENSLTLESRFGEEISVDITKETKIKEEIKEGDEIIIMGNKSGNTIKAAGIKRAPEEFKDLDNHMRIRMHKMMK